MVGAEAAERLWWSRLGAAVGGAAATVAPSTNRLRIFSAACRVGFIFAGFLLLPGFFHCRAFLFLGAGLGIVGVGGVAAEAF